MRFFYGFGLPGEVVATGEAAAVAALSDESEVAIIGLPGRDEHAVLGLC